MARTIANGYEVERGMQEVGETADAGYQVGVQRTVYAERGAVWEHRLSAAGLGTWLGDTDDFEAEPGRDYETGDGTVGEVRTVSESERLRMTWQPAGRDEPTTPQFTLSGPRNDDSKTTHRFHHEKIADAGEREAMRAHWRVAPDRIEASVADEA